MREGSGVGGRGGQERGGEEQSAGSHSCRHRARLIVGVLAMVVVVAAGKDNGGQGTCIRTFSVSGKKFKLQNSPVTDGLVCPEGNPSTVTFCKNSNEVFIVGNFAAPDLGVCDPSINYYTIPAGTKVTYAQYADQVIIQVFDRVPSAFRVLKIDGKNIAIGLSSQRYGVSTMIDIGSANC